jgi:branched-subunit amino acid ABC-type transport system permease component
MSSLIQLVFNGVVFGSIVLLAAVGLTLLYSIGNFANFAHGAIMSLGAYFTYAAAVQVGLPFLVAAVIGASLVGVFALALDRTLFIRHRDTDPLGLLILTVGVAFALRSIIRIVWGAELRSYHLPLRRSTTYLDTTLSLGNFDLLFRLQMGRKQMLIVAFALLFALVVHLFLTRTKLGIAMRATSDNRFLSKITGINTDTVLSVTWLLSGVLAALGGIFLGVQLGSVYPRMGFDILLVTFAAVILGGIGSPYGAMVGAYIISIAQEMSIVLPGVTPGYRFGISFFILILVLLYKPEGITGVSET